MDESFGAAILLLVIFSTIIISVVLFNGDPDIADALRQIMLDMAGLN